MAARRTVKPRPDEPHRIAPYSIWRELAAVDGVERRVTVIRCTDDAVTFRDHMDDRWALSLRVFRVNYVPLDYPRL